MILKSFLGLIFPSRCIGCEAWLATSHPPLICDVCFGKLHFLSSRVHCPKLKKKYFGEGFSALAYEGWVLQAIHQFKYHRQFHVGRELGELLLQTRVPWEDYDGVTYVPLHWRRHIWRGFNPSQFLAAWVSKRRGKPLLSLLKRSRRTPPQAKLSQEARLQNVHGAFTVRTKLLKNILLIDDVLTTGSTVNECARALIGGGAEKVDILTVARTL